MPQPVQLAGRQLRLRARGLPRLLLTPQRELEALVPRRRPRHRPRLPLLHRFPALLPRLDREVEWDGGGGVVAGGDGSRRVGELEGADAADDAEDSTAGASAGDAGGEGLGGRLATGVSRRCQLGAVVAGLVGRSCLGGGRGRRGAGGGVVVLRGGAVQPWRRRRGLRGWGEERQRRWRHGGLGSARARRSLCSALVSGEWGRVGVR